MSDFDTFTGTYLRGDEPVIEPQVTADGWPSVIVRHGRFQAVLTFQGHRDHLGIDVHPFVEGEDARAGVFGLEAGRRITFAADTAAGTSHEWPAARLITVLIGEQAATGDNPEQHVVAP